MKIITNTGWAAGLPTTGDGVHTTVAQPAIVTAELAGLALLDRLGISADVAVGHSLGELTALAWAGAWSEAALLEIARARGEAMAALADDGGAMAGLEADGETVAALVGDVPGLHPAGFNSPRQTVVSGPAAAIEAALERAKERGLEATRLQVSHAFHSPLVAAAAQFEIRPTGRIDRYQRAIAFVVIDGRDLGETLIAEGLARRIVEGNVPDLRTPEGLEMIEWLRELYDEGIVNPTFMIGDQDESQGAFIRDDLPRAPADEAFRLAHEASLADMPPPARDRIPLSRLYLDRGARGYGPDAVDHGGPGDVVWKCNGGHCRQPGDH